MNRDYVDPVTEDAIHTEEIFDDKWSEDSLFDEEEALYGEEDNEPVEEREFRPERITLDEDRQLELEEKIRDKVGILYSAGEEDYVPASCQRPALVEDLWKYTIWHNGYKQYNPAEYAPEIVDTCEAVFNAYSPEAGDFIHYYNVAISKKLKSLSGEAQYNKGHQESGLPARKIEAINKAVRKLIGQGIEIDADMVIQMAKDDNITLDSYDFLTYKNYDIKYDSPIEGDTENNTDYLNFIFDNTTRPENKLFNRASLEELIAIIEEVYEGISASQKKYMHETLTSQFSEAINEMLKEHEDLLDVLNETSWFVPEVFDIYQKTEMRKEQQIIANEYDVTAVTVSRAMGEFKEKLKERINMGKR